MELLLQDHAKLQRKRSSSKCIQSVQATLHLLQGAHDEIARGSSSTSVLLAKLQNPVKKSFDDTNELLREQYATLNKCSKSLDKFFKDKPLPTSEYDRLNANPSLLDRAIAMHFLREGQFGLASAFIEESQAATPSVVLQQRDSQNIKDSKTVLIQDEFKAMYSILNELQKRKNLLPAIQWARGKSYILEERGSNLEFELGKLQFVWLFQGGDQPNPMVSEESRCRAIEYAREAFPSFRGRYLREIQQLLGAMVFCPNLYDSPYHDIFFNESGWDDAAKSFTHEFCSLLGLSADSPLYIAATAGAIALPTLLKLQSIMKEKRTEWTTEDELPVEVPLPSSYQFHSIFVCPVSKEQSTDRNPPMMMPCGHVIAQESLARLSRGGKFKCPYCPVESHSKDARKIVL